MKGLAKIDSFELQCLIIVALPACAIGSGRVLVGAVVGVILVI
jgi:hypothetical protein